VWNSNEAKRARVENVRLHTRTRIEPAEDDQFGDLLGKTGKEVHEGDVARDGVALPPVAIAGEDAKSHGADIFAARAPLVSVVIPALDEATHIRRCLRSIMAQRPRPLEVIVVDGSSSDATREIARQEGATVISNPKRIIPAALNCGLAAARGDVLVRFDAHSEMTPGYLEACLRALASDPAAINAGGWCEVRGERPWGRALAAALSSPFGVGNARLWRRPANGSTRAQVDSVPFGCYRASALRSIGGWENGLPVNEDFALNARLRAAGGRVIFDPSIQALYHPRESLGQIARQYWRYGRWKAAMLKRSPRSLRARQLAPPALLATIALAFVPRREALPARLAVAGYVGGLGFASARAGGGLRTAVLLASLHLSWGSGFLYGLVSGSALDPRRADDATRAP
jgi:succinoglycan biosynthesis protein ExoA